MAAFHKDRVEKVTGRLGLWLMVAFGAYLLIPNFFQESSMATETYFLFVIWSVLGLLFFHFVLREDRQNRFGNAMAVWIVFLSLILFVSLVWMSQYTMRATREGMYELQNHFVSLGASDDAVGLPVDTWQFETYTVEEYEELKAKVASGEIVIDDAAAENDPNAKGPWDNVIVNYVE